jgi:predicted RNase H-like nuclease (RuvC/YqgF family)
MSVLLSACETTPITPVNQKCEPASDRPDRLDRLDRSDQLDRSDKVPSLQRQIREKDKRIKELESQLEVLKLIDQDSKKQRNPLRTPPALTPIK